MPVQIGPGAADSPAGGGRRRCVEALQDARGTLTRAGPEHGPDPVAPAPTPRLQISTLQCREMPSARACARQGTGRPQHMGAALRSDKAPSRGPFPGWIPARCAPDCWPVRCAGRQRIYRRAQAHPRHRWRSRARANPRGVLAPAVRVRALTRPVRSDCRRRHRAWTSEALMNRNATAAGCTCECWSAKWFFCGSIWRKLVSVLVSVLVRAPPCPARSRGRQTPNGGAFPWPESRGRRPCMVGICPSHSFHLAPAPPPVPAQRAPSRPGRSWKGPTCQQRSVLL